MRCAATSFSIILDPYPSLHPQTYPFILLSIYQAIHICTCPPAFPWTHLSRHPISLSCYPNICFCPSIFPSPHPSFNIAISPPKHPCRAIAVLCRPLYYKDGGLLITSCNVPGPTSDAASGRHSSQYYRNNFNYLSTLTDSTCGIKTLGDC